MLPVAIIQNCEVEGPGNIVDYLKKRSVDYSIIHPYKNDPLPKVNDVEFIISLGCPLSFLDHEKHRFLRELFALTKRLMEQGKPFLGICYSAQMLAAAMGARVYRNPVKEIGAIELQLTESGAADPLFASVGTRFPVLQWHGDTFETPDGTENLAFSEHCRNQAFRKGRMVGLQFHLEADENRIPLWCEAYADELAGEGLDENEIISEYKAVADTTRQLSYTLLDNFFSL